MAVLPLLIAVITENKYLVYFTGAIIIMAIGIVKAYLD
jgi:hypothetical protein